MDRYSCNNHNLYCNWNKQRMYKYCKCYNYGYANSNCYHHNNRRNNLFGKLNNHYRIGCNYLHLDAGKFVGNNSYCFSNHNNNLHRHRNCREWLHRNCNKNNHCQSFANRYCNCNKHIALFGKFNYTFCEWRDNL